MAWTMKGTYFENCSCNTICPCTWSAFTAPADTERCRALLAFHVDDGQVDGVDVAGLGFAMLVDTPRVMADGGWRMGVFLDDAATPQQQESLGAVLGGALGGPPAALGPLLGEMLGIQVVPFDYSDDGLRHRVRIGDGVDIEVEDYVAGGADGPVRLTHVSHPAGTTLTVGRGLRSRVSAFGIELDGEGRSALSAPFAWSA